MSGMSTGLSGVQSAAQSMAATAGHIAHGATPTYEARRPEQYLEEPPEPEAVRENQEAGPKESNADLADQAMNLKTDRVTYEANLQFLQVQSSLLGTALDMKA